MVFKRIVPPKVYKAGLLADRPVSPIIGDIYICTDKNMIYVCYQTGYWRWADIRNFVSSANVRNSNDSEVSVASETFVILKQITINEPIPACTIQYEARSSLAANNWVRAGVGKNGTQLADTLFNNGTTYASDSLELINLIPGDLVQVFGRASSGAYSIFIRNMQVRYDRSLSPVEVLAMTNNF